MKRLSMGDWSLIARYLAKEASQSEVDQLQALVEHHPNLAQELEMLGHGLNNSGRSSPDTFNANKAFERLTKRFKKENLI
jgi:hypothetical protein